MLGKLFAVGVGPGDSELLTIKALNVLRNVDYVFAPSGNNDNGLAINIVKNYINCPYILLDFPMSGEFKDKIKANAEIVYEKLSDGKNCAFITLGDVSIYNSFWYLYDELLNINKNLEIEIIPGITSFSLASAKLKIPIAQKDESFCVVPFGNLEIIRSNLFKTIVFLKPTKDTENMVAELKLNGYKDINLAEKLGMKNEKIGNVSEFDLSQREYMRIIIAKK